jgi:phosphatidylglycerophosphate synthase
MLTTHYKGLFNRLLEGPARVIAHCGVHPTVITWLGPVLVAACCLWYVQVQDTVGFVWAVLLCGLTDALDGPVARLSGKASAVGAYADAMADRYVECFVVLAVAYVSGYWALLLIFLAGSMLMSYAKARTAIEVPISNLEWPDLAERTERSVLFLLGLLLGAWVPWRPLGHDLFWWTLLGLNAVVHLSVLQRMRRAHQLIAQRG